MAFTSKTFKYIVPKSESDPNHEDFEYLLVWRGRDGSLLTLMFTNREFGVSAKTTVFNESDEFSIQNFVDSEANTVDLVSEDLTFDETEIYRSIYAQKFAIRLKKNGSQERLAIESNKLVIVRTDLRYNLEIKLRLPELALPK